MYGESRHAIEFDDDTHLIVPAVNSWSCDAELAPITLDLCMAERNNLLLNCSKTKEIIFRSKGKRGRTAQMPPTCEGIQGASSLTALASLAMAE